MPTAKKKNNQNMPVAKDSGGKISYEAEFWEMAYALRGPRDAAGCKNIVVGVLFLNYNSDSFQLPRDETGDEQKIGTESSDLNAESLFKTATSTPLSRSPEVRPRLGGFRCRAK